VPAPKAFSGNEDKAASNWRDHGVAFSEAVRVRYPLAVEQIDDREEEGINIIALCDGALLHVTYTERDDRTT
jgi:uncharacterized DUF497 family protein